ncbi:MAG: hypothetical protein ACK5HJ_09145 [Bacteroidota bacterium]|jgi:hypothetical protein
MSNHDIHQLFFEKYLREKMNESERVSFEERLKTDDDLRNAFEQYKQNRKLYLREMLQEEYAANSTRFRLNSILYLLISLICLSIAAGYFFDNRKLRSLLTKYSLASSPVAKNRTPQIIKTPPEIQTQAPEKEALLPGEETEKADISIAEGDVMLQDTVLSIAFERTDSASTAAPILVERWQSPVGFKGYRYNGIQLQLYGIESFSDFELYSEKDDLWMKLDDKHILLNPDFNFYKY